MEVFFTALGGTTVALLIAGYLARRFMDIQVSNAIEKYKSELEQKSATLKTELSIYAHEQNVGLSRLDDQRSQAIILIYGSVNKWQEIYFDICQPNEPKLLEQEHKYDRYLKLSKNLVNEAEELSIIARDNIIFFQEDSFEVISKYGKAELDISCAFYDSTFGKFNLTTRPDYGELFPMIKKERSTLRNNVEEKEFKNKKKLLVAEFRKLMKAEKSQQLTSPSS